MSNEEFSTLRHKITTPAGRPPFELEGTEPSLIDEWAKKIAASGPYTINAIQYWVRYFYGTGTPEHKVIRQYLKESATRLKIPYIS